MHCQWITSHYLRHLALSFSWWGCCLCTPGHLWLFASMSCWCSQLYPLCQWAVTNMKTHLTSGLLNLLVLNRCWLGKGFSRSCLKGWVTSAWKVSCGNARKASQMVIFGLKVSTYTCKCVTMYIDRDNISSYLVLKTAMYMENHLWPFYITF